MYNATMLAAGGEAIVVLIFVAFVALIIVGSIAGARAARRRQEALAALANELGFAFDPSSNRGSPPGTDAFGIFTRGDRRRYENTLTGQRAIGQAQRLVAIAMGDYQFTTESGTGENKSETTHYVGYLLARLPFVVCGRLVVRHEGLLDKFAGAIGFEDINFESDAFSRRFHVSSDDKKVAYDLFDPRMIEWAMANDIPSLEVRGSLMVIAQEQRRTPEQFRQQLDWATAFLERWPEHLVQRLEGVQA